MPKKSNKRSNKRTRTRTRTRTKKVNNKSRRNRKMGLRPKCGSKCTYLKGGAGCGSPGCPISPLSIEQMNSQKGGTCQTCSNIQLGGRIPPPFVPSNSAWGPTANKWPGVDGVPNSRNYLSPYNPDNNPQQQMSMADAGYKTPNSLVGGKKNKKLLKKGGGLIPQDFVNLGRDFSYNFKSAYNSLNGYKPPVDPSPYKGQLTGALNSNTFNF